MFTESTINKPAVRRPRASGPGQPPAASGPPAVLRLSQVLASRRAQDAAAASQLAATQAAAASQLAAAQAAAASQLAATQAAAASQLAADRVVDDLRQAALATLAAARELRDARQAALETLAAAHQATPPQAAWEPPAWAGAAWEAPAWEAPAWEAPAWEAQWAPAAPMTPLWFSQQRLKAAEQVAIHNLKALRNRVAAGDTIEAAELAAVAEEGQRVRALRIHHGKKYYSAVDKGHRIRANLLPAAVDEIAAAAAGAPIGDAAYRLALKGYVSPEKAAHAAQGVPCPRWVVYGPH